MTDRSAEDEPPQCSAKGCRAPAAWAIRWRNPKIHASDRRKIWLACDEHRAFLSDFLGRRGFPRDVVPLADIDADIDAAPGTGRNAGPDTGRPDTDRPDRGGDRPGG